MPPQKTLRDFVYKKIVDEILSGRLSPGDQLLELELAKKYKVSRTPIREALLQLEKKRFIVQKPKRSAVVQKMDMKQVEDIYRVIALLEGYAAEVVVAAEPDKRDLSYLKELVKEMEGYAKTKDYSRYLEKNNSFHAFFAERCGNDPLSDIVSDLRKRVFRTLSRGFTIPNHIEQYLESHREIVNSALNGEAERVGQMMRNHDLDAVKFMIVDRIR
jgi:DNA-binding GntR family transcriptional regulator